MKLLLVILLCVICRSILLADAPGMRAMQVKLIDNKNNESIEYITIDWTDRLSIGKIKNLNEGTELINLFKENNPYAFREKTNRYYNLKGELSRIDSFYVFSYNFNKSNLEYEGKEKSTLSGFGNFCSFEETSNLEISNYKSIIFIKWANNLHDCNGFEKLPIKEINKLIENKITEIMLIKNYGYTVYLINIGEANLDKLKLFGKFYYFLSNPENFNFSNVIEQKLYDELRHLVEISKTNNDYEKYRKELINIGFKHDTIIVQVQWD